MRIMYSPTVCNKMRTDPCLRAGILTLVFLVQFATMVHCVCAQELEIIDVLHASTPRRFGNYGQAVVLTEQYLVVGGRHESNRHRRCF